MGLCSCLAIFGTKRQSNTHHLEKGNSHGSDVSDLERKEMEEENSHYSETEAPMQLPPSLQHQDSILQPAFNIEKTEFAGIVTPPGTATAYKSRGERPDLGSPRSTKSKVSFSSSSEGTGHRSTNVIGGIHCGKVGSPTQFQVSDGVQEFSSRLYTSDNTKTKASKRRSSGLW